MVDLAISVVLKILDWWLDGRISEEEYDKAYKETEFTDALLRGDIDYLGTAIWRLPA